MNDELRVKNNELGGKMKYRYRTDEEMKDNESGFLERIPNDWKVAKAQYYFNVYAGGTPSTNEPAYWDGDIPWINSGEVQNCIVKKISRYITERGLEESSTKLIPKNTTLLAMTGATCGKVGYLTFDSTANQSVMAFTEPRNCSSKFLFYYLICQNHQIEYFKTGGAQGGINVDNGKKLYINIPSKTEQEKIAKFLDEKTAQFDSIISKKEALIEKLEEAKKSLISEVVTGKVKVVKSSDEYEVVERKKEEMKDSGVEWLGDIPKEWEVKAIKYLFSLRNERNYKEMGEVQLLSLYTNLGVLKQGDVEARGNKVRTVEDYKEVYPNDIIVNIILAWMGAIGMSEYRGVISPAYDIYEPINKNTISKYYHYVFRTGRFAGECYKKGRGIMDMRWRTYSDEFKSILVPDLSVEEKNIIVECIDKKINEVEALIKNIEEQIEKLKEAKQSLISEAVTGKIEILD